MTEPGSAVKPVVAGRVGASIPLAVLAAAMMLGGCASPGGGGTAPIEDRAAPRPAAPQPAAPLPTPTVRAMPVPATPLPEPSALPEPDDYTVPGLEPLPAPPPTLAHAEPPSAPAPTAARPVQSLLDAATAAAERGEWDRAQATLERALKLAPNDPSVWTQLAYTHFRQGQFEQAHELAERGLAVSTAGGPEQAALWQLIADVEMARGNVDAAQAARARALGEP